MDHDVHGLLGIRELLLAESEQVPFSTIGPAGDMAPAMALSKREREILRLVEGGLSNSEIAHKLVIEVNTVKSHLHRIYQRLSVATGLPGVGCGSGHA